MTRGSSGQHSALLAATTERVLVVRRAPRRGRTTMADVAYVLVLVGGFALLALTLRGLERL